MQIFIHCKVECESIKVKIIEQLKKSWSPEQISGRGRLNGDFDLSHQTIYNWIAANKRNGGKIYLHLRQTRKYRKHKTKDTHIKNRIKIDQRPAEVETRGRFGDWEIDSIVSSKGDKTIILSIIEHVRPCLCASMLESRDAFPLPHLAKIVVL